MNTPSLPEVMRALPDAHGALVRAVLDAARSRGDRVYLVGGPVRDFLIGRPIRDVDLLVLAREGGGAEDLARAAAPSDSRVTAHGRFGTVTLESGGVSVDLATSRRESYAHDGALPRVEPGSLEEDLRRRDFTVNAMALPLSRAARADGTAIVDVEDGREDLGARRLRVIHTRSFHDDPTRALRAARLAPRLGFSLTRGSRSGLRDALRDGSFGRVSGDRLRREVVKLFDDAVCGLDPSRALRLLADWHVLGALEPGLTLPRESVAPLRRVGRSVENPAWTHGRLRPWVAGFCVWLAPLAPGLRRRTLRRFSLRGDLAAGIAAYPGTRDEKLRAIGRARGRGAIDAALAAFDEERLLALYVAAPVPIRRRIVRYAREDRGRRTPVSGDDLVALGFSGPALGRALSRIRSAHLDGGVRTRPEALALAAELARRSAARGTTRRRKA